MSYSKIIGFLLFFFLQQSFDSIPMALESSLSSLIQQCETAVVADPTVSVNFNTTVDQLVPYVLNLTCLNDCSNRGSCNQGIKF